MVGWIGKLFGKRTAAQKGRENPVLQAAVNESAQIYDRIPLGQIIDESRRSELARKLYLEINRICNTANPLTVCRDTFARAMLKLASYQVLVIPAEPGEDVSGLRGQPGISGELTQHLVELCEKNDQLRSTMYGATDSREFGDLQKIVECLYWETYWLLGTLNATRVALGDTVQNDDWYEPFLHAACANQEHIYRWELELPPAFPAEIAGEAAGAYAVFTDIVISGGSNPVAEWRDYCRGTAVPMPEFKQ